MSEPIVPLVLEVAQTELEDLQQRLDRIRWPERETVSDWSQGVPLGRLRELVEHWRDGYDWRRCEALLNGMGQYRTRIDGLGIQFMHVRSPHAGAMPLLITHGWPGSVLEFRKIIGPLTDPAAHGGRAEDAFDLVLPSLPGFGFSDKPEQPGWNMQRIAHAWNTLMSRLGYDRYVAQGGDWGSGITTMLGALHPPGLAAIHVTLPLVLPEGPYDNLTPREAEMLASLQSYERWDSGYSKQMSTRPQTVGYALADSPVGQAAWIYEKFRTWMDCDGDPLSILTKDEILDNIMMYWLPNTAASSGRIYWESFVGGFGAVDLNVPVGCSIFAKEIYRAPRTWAERCMHRLIYWNEIDRGGHFAALEQPGIFVDEMRNCFRSVRHQAVRH